MKHLVVTGGLGMLGSNLVNASFSRFDSITVIDSNIRGMKDYAINLWGENKYDLIEEDVREISKDNVDKLLSKHGDIYFVHLADVVAGIGYVFNNQFSILEENTSIDIAAFKLSKMIDASKVLYASTACVFNQASQRSLDAKVSISKDLFPANPESTYGWAKLFGELALFNLYDEADNVGVIYFHNLIGTPCDFWSERSQMLPSIVNRLLSLPDDEPKVLTVWGSGKQGRALVPVQLAVESILNTLSLEKIQKRNQVGPEFCTSIREVAEILLSKTDGKYVLDFDLTKPEGDIGRSVAAGESRLVAKITMDDIRQVIGDVYLWVKERKV
ncbi:NAD-dependent epimerase/dehydratase family protein [Bacterioplanoides sp.]|uniref:NAD-dependent epimerase/dehydratase family protein n=1 Tax=Bacterioplanoides sp. TaxID=2066072 RepID=UPI003B5CE0BF